MKKFLLISLLLAGCACAQSPKDFAPFRDSFIRGYRALYIPPLSLSYAENLQHISGIYEIDRQLDFFRSADKQLKTFENIWISDDERRDYDLMRFETDLNLQRLSLERKWPEEKPAAIPTNNIFLIPHGKEWYAYFLNRWLGAKVNADELFLNAIEEAERVKQQWQETLQENGLSAEQFYTYTDENRFYINSEAQLKEAFESVKDIVQQRLPALFHVRQVNDMDISRGTNAALAHTPGYYSNNTFYYNFSNQPYDSRQVDWLYLHEAVPGHHYQSCIAAFTTRSAVQQLFHYPGFSEGWSAYVETLGKDLGTYKTWYDALGGIEWNLIRSVRVVLDIGLNYYGWTEDKALAKWKEYILHKDDIAMREINRIKRWPAQAVTYKYGATLIQQWKKELQEEQGTAFDIKDFHDRLLNHGSLPFFMVSKNVFRRHAVTASSN